MSAEGATSEFEPVRVTGVVTERVGRPRNDGTPGSELYAVPLQLSRTPSSQWRDFFEACWNNPPTSSTMHRPGIASVVEDAIVLGSTTIDEVEEHHLKTVRLCVVQANENEGARKDRVRDQRKTDDDARLEHQAHVKEVADRLEFDD
ncbi:MAG: hypothetical protein WD556_10490 [Actinomycetota bacterium]